MMSSQPCESGKRTLLITDDALIIREMIKDLATQAGWTVVGEACNGQEAIERYAALKPDAVTLDLVMPEHDGLHALRGIMQINPSAKVVVISALEQKTVLKEAFKAGAADFLVKPFNRQSLVSTLDQLTPTPSSAACAFCEFQTPRTSVGRAAAEGQSIQGDIA